MAGSSGWYFVRAAYEQGMIDRRRLAGDLVDAMKFRLWGSTDAGTAKVRARMGTYLAGVHERDLRRMAPRVLAGVLPRLYPQMLAVAYEHQDAGRPIYICTAASQEMAQLMSLVLSFDGGIGSRAEVIDGVYTGREGGLFTYREGKAQAIAELAARKGFDLAAVLRLLRLGVRPADAARRRPSRGGQPRQHAGAGRPRGGLGGPAPRPPAPPPEGRSRRRSPPRRRAARAGRRWPGGRRRVVVSPPRSRRLPRRQRCRQSGAAPRAAPLTFPANRLG